MTKGTEKTGQSLLLDSDIMRKARKLVSQYRVTIESHERLGFIGSSVEMPSVFVDAKTHAECYEAIQEALTVTVAMMLKNGQKPPQPASAAKRTTQVNVRLSLDEKQSIALAAKKYGFQGVADFIRNAALKHAYH